MEKQNRLSDSTENYLRVIFDLKHTKGSVRVKDISEALAVRKPSVTVAVGMLRRSGYVKHESYGDIELTASGKKLAGEISRKHELVSRFLSDILKVDPRHAAVDACRMEHVMSPRTFEKMIKFIEFLGVGPEGGATHCLSRFYEFCENGKRTKCQECNP